MADWLDQRLRRGWDMPWLFGLEIRPRLTWPLVRAPFVWHGID